MKRALVLVSAFLMTACAAQAKTATANLKGTAEGSSIIGAVNFEETESGLKVTADVKGVPPGKHGFHIHENGACGNEGNDAGGHFNPAGVSHGLLPKDGHSHAHAGDMGNLEAGEDGTGKLEITLPQVSLSEGDYNVSGKAVILHEKEDDFGQPTGNAGGRIACGVIE